MTEEERLAKLEALLVRVRSRSRAPEEAAPPSSPGLTSSASSGRTPFDLETPLAGFRPSALPSVPPSEPLPPYRAKHTSRPEVPAGPLFEPPESSRVRAFEPRFANREPPPMEVVELEVDPDPSIPPPAPDEPTDSWEVPPPDDLPPSPPGAPALESRSRLVIAPPSPLPADVLERHPEESRSPRAPPSDPTIEVAAAEVSQGELDALEADNAPSSSRRPISMEEKMNELDDDAVPLHPSPPASGKLPSVSPAIELEEVSPNLPPQADVALFVATPRSEPPRTTFGDLLEEALRL